MLGFLNIYKPSGMTSNDVVQKIKKRFHIKKIGHMGTLDPMACGILPIAIGKATRLFDFSLNKDKKYIATFDFGYTTDTIDITGNIFDELGIVPSVDEINSVIPKCIGEVKQVPPLFSAKNINGERAYNLARKGIDFEISPKCVKINYIKLIDRVDETSFRFEISCSSGTYIRSIARDLAKELGTFACMSALERIETGSFSMKNYVDLDTLINGSIEDYLISPLSAFPNVPIINISYNQFKDLIDGKEVMYKNLDKPTFVLYDNKIVGLAESGRNNIKLCTFLYEEGDENG